MILHTIALHSELLPPVQYAKPCYIKVDGCICECVNDGRDIKLSRIISTDLKDYLKYSPGESVK